MHVWRQVSSGYHIDFQSEGQWFVPGLHCLVVSLNLKETLLHIVSL